jgi:hypothetical protein
MTWVGIALRYAVSRPFCSNRTRKELAAPARDLDLVHGNVRYLVGGRTRILPRRGRFRGRLLFRLVRLLRVFAGLPGLPLFGFLHIRQVLYYRSRRLPFPNAAAGILRDWPKLWPPASRVSAAVLTMDGRFSVERVSALRFPRLGRPAGRGRSVRISCRGSRCGPHRHYRVYVGLILGSAHREPGRPFSCGSGLHRRWSELRFGS